jgi:class 3 adenylate cyclase
LAQKRNDFAGYIEHNNEYQRITEEVRGRDATLKMAMMEAERNMEGERREREKERALLYGALPESVANRMLRGEDVSGDHFDHASVMFLDVVGFTTNAHDLEPRVVTNVLDDVFNAIDEICATHNVTKIKTIGDAYLAVAFPHDDQSTEQNIASVALAIQQLQFTWPNESPLQFRIGLHSGPVVAGVIGKQRLQYDVWGDTVNTASRMESASEPGRIHISEAFATLMPATSAGDSFERPLQVMERGEIDIKGKGTMTTYWLERSLT